ncbi:MAG: transketolase, partial [Planctomycetes bacterium]|nr:transketolase [Planctomycetota bacterium]
MSTATIPLEQLAINTIRTLSMDAVQKANSGHPGTPMALAPVVYTLWNEVLKYDPADPLWPSRDRFVLSAGHASMLLYSILHLAGVRDVDAAGKVLDAPAIPLDHIRNFRQLHSRCAGHPEHGEAPGIETTTGPLGQGVANSVGMAIAERWLAARLNRPGCDVFDYNVYAICSDGDLMEGISSEAASIAGHLRLSNLCWIYDDNHITIEGSTDLAFSEDVATRFQGYRWNTVRVEDANDRDELRRAFKAFAQTTDRPTLIIVRSHIAWGAPNKQDTHGAHGSPLGADEIRLTKAVYGWPEDAQFRVPAEVLTHLQEGIGARGRGLRAQWEERFTAWKKKHPELAQQWDCMRRGELPKDWDADLTPFPADPKGIATRKSSAKALNQVAQRVTWMIGGSADLAESTFTTLTFDEAQGSFEAGTYAGRNFHFGIREHGMAGVLNGLALSHIRPFGSTFLVFSDYCRPSIRLSAIMRLPVIYVFTHDSIGVGEDGPTHQPIEHLSSMRAIPGLHVFRPGDANEV